MSFTIFRFYDKLFKPAPGTARCVYGDSHRYDRKLMTAVMVTGHGKKLDG